MTDDNLQIHPHLRALINPRVLQEVRDRIAAAEEQEDGNSYSYSQYLRTHADHLLREATRRGHRNSTEAAA